MRGASPGLVKAEIGSSDGVSNASVAGVTGYRLVDYRLGNCGGAKRMELASRLNAKKNCPTFARPRPFCNRCSRLGLAHQERIGSSPQNTRRTETHTGRYRHPAHTYLQCLSPCCVPGTLNPSPLTSLNDGAYATPRIREPAVSAPSPPLLLLLRRSLLLFARGAVPVRPAFGGPSWRCTARRRSVLMARLQRERVGSSQASVCGLILVLGFFAIAASSSTSPSEVSLSVRPCVVPVPFPPWRSSRF
ncbi:hypothetical protein EDB80DRAFT_97709 [Ilyonectria destructans]|nr:hypothetical protein EDB80DRAFT_97709 [Ilyonectria destructans]